MDLQTIVENTPRILGVAVAVTAIAYPVYSALQYITGEMNSFKEALNDTSTVNMAAGISVGTLLCQYGALFFK